jgi:hypothetical protein
MEIHEHCDGLSTWIAKCFNAIFESKHNKGLNDKASETQTKF